MSLEMELCNMKKIRGIRAKNLFSSVLREHGIYNSEIATQLLDVLTQEFILEKPSQPNLERLAFDREAAG